MSVHKEKYEELMLRFAKELYDVGVTDELKALVQDQMDRTPNVVSCGSEVKTDRFAYRHDGYLIEADRTVRLTIRKCS